MCSVKLILLILLIYSSIYAQENVSDEKYIQFKVSDYNPDAGLDNWNVDNLTSEFELNGKIPLQFSIRLVNDSIMELSQKLKNGVKIIDIQEYYPFTWTLDKDIITSSFRITDFNKDGNEDLLCWTQSNMNGNQWTIIYINDNENSRLAKLWDPAEETDIWDRPEYDKSGKIINTTLDASVFGISNECTYRLDGLKVIPLTKDEEDRTSTKYIMNKTYRGENGKWKLVKSKKHRG